MECLACGDCCKKMCPLSPGEPCKHLVEKKETIFLCSIYDKRPEQCRKHDFPYSVCPIGMNVLKIETPAAKHKRIDTVYEILKR